MRWADEKSSWKEKEKLRQVITEKIPIPISISVSNPPSIVFKNKKTTNCIFQSIKKLLTHSQLPVVGLVFLVPKFKSFIVFYQLLTDWLALLKNRQILHVIVLRTYREGYRDWPFIIGYTARRQVYWCWVLPLHLSSYSKFFSKVSDYFQVYIVPCLS